jgi:tripeptide aminopeptidase
LRETEGKRAGDATNVVIDYMHIKSEARSSDTAFAAKIANGFCEAFAKAQGEVKDYEGATAEVKFESRPSYPSFNLADDSSVVLYANWLDQHGVPTVTIVIGAGQYEIHTVNEYVNLPEFADGCRPAVALATLEA